MSGPLAPPQLRSVRQQASELLRVAIYDGELAPGERLTEREICERYGVSRTIAREVIRELEAERLIESNRRHGYIVARMSEAEIHDLYDVRILLEAEACALCAASMTAERGGRLDASMAAIEAAAASGDRQAQRDSNGRLYDEIFAGAGNVVLGQILNSLHGRVSYLRSLSMSQPGRPTASLTEIRALYAALKAGDGMEAARLSTEHIRAARNVALAAIRALAERSSS
jgi:DNA-binding GntR family transcriptional regulator